MVSFMAFICLFLLVCVSSYFYTTISGLYDRIEHIEAQLNRTIELNSGIVKYLRDELDREIESLKD